jgi:uncharacterized glyoxalase superfamily protein PhnB
MTEARTVSSEVEVGVAPATAFTAFTEEMDLWWVRGPINFWSDGGRVVEIRCEPGVGGRITEFEALDDLSEGPDPVPRGEYGHPWIELRIGNAAVMVFPLDDERAAGTPALVPWVYVDDLEEHFSRVKGAGATIVEEPHPLPGSSLYVAEDPERNRWTFLQARRTMR